MKYLAQVKASRATAVLVSPDFAEDIPAVAIRVANPSQAFTQLLEKFAPPAIELAPGIHPSAVVGRGVILGDKVSIQPFVVIEDGAQISAHTVIGAYGYVGTRPTLARDANWRRRLPSGHDACWVTG